MKYAKNLFFVLILLATSVQAQQEIVDFTEALESGNVRVESLRGNGSSTGSAVVGRIRNVSQSPIRVDIHFDDPLYLRNQGSGQEMIAIRIYNRNGGYLSDGENDFLELNATETSDVIMLAYSVDPEKRNPRVADTFEIASMPENLASVASKISQYKEDNPSRQMAVGAQLALWMAQGHEPEEIRGSFGFSASDERLARQILDQ